MESSSEKVWAVVFSVMTADVLAARSQGVSDSPSAPSGGFLPGVVVQCGNKFVYVEAWSESARIDQVNRLVIYIRIKIHTPVEFAWVLAYEAAYRVVVSGAIVVQASFGVRFARCVLEWVGQRPRRTRLFAK